MNSRTNDVILRRRSLVEWTERGDNVHTQRPFRHDHSDYDEAGAHNKELEEKFAMQELNTIKETLMSSQQSEIVMLHSLQKLVHLRITVDALKPGLAMCTFFVKATEIGKQVNNLRKHSSKAVRSLVRQLVRSWKVVVDEWVKSEGDVPAFIVGAPVGHVLSEGDTKEQGSTPPHDESIIALAGGTNTFLNCMDDELRYQNIYCKEENHLDLHPQSTGLRADYCNHDSKVWASHNDWASPEEMGSSSSFELPGLQRLQKMEKKPQLYRRGPSSQIAKDQRGMNNFCGLSMSKSCSAGSGTRRPVKDAFKVKGIGPSGNLGLGKIVSEYPKAKKNYDLDGDDRWENKELKIMTGICTTTLGAVQAAEKLETAKRKLHEGYWQADYERKQGTVSRFDLPDFPKGGPTRSNIPSAGQSRVASHSGH